MLQALRKLWMRLVDSLKIRTTLLIALVMIVLLSLFVLYDVNQQRKALEDALWKRGESMALSGAETISHIFEDAIATGRLTEEQVFDTNYELFMEFDSATCPGVEKPETLNKYHTAYDSFTDENILEIQDAYKQDDVLYAVAVDREEAYVPTHNTTDSKPLTGNCQEDLVGNRTKRKFKDFEPILAAGRSQTLLRLPYNRDTGEVAWNVSAPIFVNGQHWGGFLVGFSLEEVDDIEASVRLRVVTAALLLVVAIGALAFFIARSIANPILALRDATVSLSQGDLNRKIPVGSRFKDELSELAEALDAMVTTWREIIGGLRDDAVRLSTTAAQLAASSEELSRTTAAQSDEISRTASAAEEMAASIREVAHNAEQAAQAATASSQHAQGGGALTAETASRLEQADQTMQQLRARSDEIGKIVSLIQEVAAQTNILALNAAIEAAGAGAAGARFDVVAEEIRKLASRTRQATGEIAELISAVQADTQIAAQAISESAAQAKESGESLADIVASSASVNDMVQSISAATAEQSLAGGEIANSIDAMANGSQQTAIATRETAQIGVELSNLAERLKEAADQFKV